MNATQTSPLKKICSVEGCGRTRSAYGLCQSHRRLQRLGKPLREVRGRGISPTERFLSYVEKTSTCWNWTAGINPLGYGKFTFQGKTVPAHRFSFANINGPIPKEMQVDHMCHNRRCVNPDHLRLVTPKQNCENRKGATSASRSGIRGVYWDAKRKSWYGTVQHNGKVFHAGRFANVEDAEAAVVKLRNSLFTHNDLDRI